MLDACSYSTDPEHISGGINTAHIVQACQESCITRTGDFLGDTTGNESINCLQCIGPGMTTTTITATRMGILLMICWCSWCQLQKLPDQCKIRKNMAGFDEESGCEEQLVQMNSHAEPTSFLQQHLPNLASPLHLSAVHKHQFNK